MTIRRLASLLGLLVLVGTGTVRAASVSVDARAAPYVFDPANRTISVGDTVVWTMLGEPHTVTSGTIDGNNVPHPDGRFDSGTRLVGEQYSLTFTEPGTFPYYCIIHADTQMKGTIVVAAAATPPPTPVPTQAPTQAPTPRPTPVRTPAPPAAPTPTPTPAPTATPAPTVTEEPTASASPTPATEAPSPSAAPAAPTPPGDAGSPAGAEASPVIVAGLLALIVLGTGGAALFARRRR